MLFWECRFENCSIKNLDFENCEAKFLQLTASSLIGINWGLLQPVGTVGTAIDKITDCHLKYNTFSKMSLKRMDFSNCALSGSTFAECVLTETSFRNADLSDTEFYKCDLRKSDFRSARGYRIDCLSCPLKGARFSMPDVLQLLDSLEIKIS